MLFKRRQPESPWQRLRIAFWPRASWRRSARYVVKRILRLRATPHAIAIGVAAGVFAAFNPFLGVHTLIAVALAWALSGNMIAAAISTWFGNPATYPFIWAGTWKLGNLILGVGAHDQPPPVVHDGMSLARIGELWRPLIEPMLVGSLPVGIVAALAAYWLARPAASAFAHRRDARLAEARAKWETEA